MDLILMVGAFVAGVVVGILCYHVIKTKWNKAVEGTQAPKIG